MPISFEVTKSEAALIRQIAERADREIFKPHRIEQVMLDTVMDLSATVAQGCALRLEELLNADSFNFTHDICGIRRHLDRSTGFLGDCFLPRFAVPLPALAATDA